MSENFGRFAGGESSTASSALCVGCSTFFSRLLAEYRKQTGNGGEKGNTFYESCGQDHVTANVVRSFRLTGNGVYCAFTDLADTDTGTDGCKTCTQCTVTRLHYIR